MFQVILCQAWVRVPGTFLIPVEGRGECPLWTPFSVLCLVPG